MQMRQIVRDLYRSHHTFKSFLVNSKELFLFIYGSVNNTDHCQTVVLFSKFTERTVLR
jgi:hypothetical protein